MTRGEPNRLKKWILTLFRATSLQSRLQTPTGEPCLIYGTERMT